MRRNWRSGLKLALINCLLADGLSQLTVCWKYSGTNASRAAIGASVPEKNVATEGVVENLGNGDVKPRARDYIFAQSSLQPGRQFSSDESESSSSGSAAAATMSAVPADSSGLATESSSNSLTPYS